jgi:hypothetical protein
MAFIWMSITDEGHHCIKSDIFFYTVNIVNDSFTRIADSLAIPLCKICVGILKVSFRVSDTEVFKAVRSILMYLHIDKGGDHDICAGPSKQHYRPPDRALRPLPTQPLTGIKMKMVNKSKHIFIVLVLPTKSVFKRWSKYAVHNIHRLVWGPAWPCTMTALYMRARKFVFLINENNHPTCCLFIKWWLHI